MAVPRRFLVYLGVGLLAGAAVRAASAGQALPPAHPFPAHTTYAVGSKRPNGPGRSQAEQDQAVTTLYARWKSRYLASAPPDPGNLPVWRVLLSADPNSRTVSEGQGYGMLLAALMAGHDPNAQAIFDGLWRYARRHPSAVDAGLMDWSVPADEKLDPNGNDSAFDGDCDMAYALLLADRQWGSGGAVNYAQAARDLLAAMKRSTLGPKSYLPLLGDWVTEEQSDSKYTEWTPRSSDFMPGHFRAFARFTDDAVWTAAAAACQGDVQLLQKKVSKKTGLLPDFIQRKQRGKTPIPARPNFLEAATDGAYSYNACRVPWRLGTDALLNGGLASRAQIAKINRWLEKSTGRNPNRIHPGYRLNGSKIGSRYFSAAFVGPIGVGAIATLGSSQAWVNRLYDAIRDSRSDYYEDSLALLSLIVMTGNFWDPTTPE